LLRGRGGVVLGALAMLAVAALALRAAPPAHAQEAPTPLRVYVVVLDGLRPFEVNQVLTPNLYALKQGGTWYEQARAVFPAETLPNHVAMMTGVLPERNGIIGNQWWYPGTGSGNAFYMEQPELLEADTLTTRLENTCGAISTATVQSKTYLENIFRGEAEHPGDQSRQREADFHWDQAPYNIPVSNHAPDQATMNEGFLPWIETNAPTPQFAFVNLGDIDRSGHTDASGSASGGGVSAARQGALADTDALIGQFVSDLQQSGAWDETVLMFTSDHGMDWSLFQDRVSPTTALDNAGYRLDLNGTPGATPGGEGDYVHVNAGGTGQIYVEDEEDIAGMARAIDALPGVAFVATPEPIPGLDNPTLADVGLDHPNNGEIVFFVDPNRRDGDGNDLPGNHGHPFTQNSVLMVSGGHPVLDDTPQSVGGETVYDPGVRLFAPPAGGPGNLSIAPTVAALFGIGQTAGGYDRPPLYEAFENHALAAHPTCGAATVDDLLYPRPASATPTRVPLVPAYAECSAPDSQHAAPLALPSCSSARRESDVVTTSSAGRGYGFLQLQAIPGDPLTTADEADIAITTEITDVRAQGGSADYAGRLLLRFGLRVTDGASGPPDGAPATVRDTEFSTPLDCAPTGNEPLGSKCNLSTSTDTLVPGFAKEGMRAVISTPSIEVKDPGADSTLAPASGTCPPTCGSGDEKVFLRQGLFTP
jgi:Type I phosphodiesterase / nucleotide pyrophosphatase